MISKEEISAIEAFIDISEYNGYEEEVKLILDNLYQANKVGLYAMKPHTDCEFVDIFWAWLVLRYGEYGTSPNSGWIEDENTILLYEVISNIMKGAQS